MTLELLRGARHRPIRDEGIELGLAIDELPGQRETKRAAGAVGILTTGLMGRQRTYEALITYANGAVSGPLVSAHGVPTSITVRHSVTTCFNPVVLP